ncbi:MAG TPA: glycosyltransferase [Lysobacter sp.]
MSIANPTDREVVSTDARVGVLVMMTTAPQEWADCIRTLQGLSGVSSVRVATCEYRNASRIYNTAGVSVCEDWTISAAVASYLKSDPKLDAILLVTAPVSVPTALLDRSVRWIQDDPRIATVSFLSNAAGYLSFPYRNTASSFSISGHDENSLTRSLRQLAPDSGMVPVAVPAGSALLLNAGVMRAVGGPDATYDDQTKVSVTEYALRCARRGFQHLLDASTFVAVQWTDGFPPVEAGDDPTARHRLHTQDTSFPALYDAQKGSEKSPLAIALDVSRSKLDGLRVLVDGSCLGPMEMGTQVQTLALIESLANRTDVQSVGVGLPGGGVPSYARRLLTMPKVSFYDSGDLMFRGAPPADILHRPFQPDRTIPWDRWRGLAKRVVVTIQDLIAYRVGAYHRVGDEWMAYRKSMQDAASNSDAVVAISDDTAQSIFQEKLNIAPDRVFVVKNGSDHLDDTAAEATPIEMVEKGMAAAPFLLVLGATYAHKNRDLAIKVWQELRRRGHGIALVMAGATVAKGSSRVDEALARRDGDEMLVTMPDVSSEARTWLLRHASLVMYPTSAEGFGLVPFEAARMGTPTVHVSFGPLKELIDSPEIPVDWSIDSLADYAERLLIDPTAGKKMIASVLKSANELTWDATADVLVSAYRRTLAEVDRG